MTLMSLAILGAAFEMDIAEAMVPEKLATASKQNRMKTRPGWRAKGVWWHIAYGQPHAFDALLLKAPEERRKRKDAVEEMRAVLAEWLGETFSKDRTTAAHKNL